MAEAAKSLLAEEDAEGRHENLCSLPTQVGQCWEGNSPELWVRVVEGLPPEAMKFFSQRCAGYPTHELSPPMG